MKKISLVLMVFALVFSFAGITFAQEEVTQDPGLTQAPPRPQDENGAIGAPKDQRGDKPGKPKGEKPKTDKQKGERPNSEKQRGDKPKGEKPKGDKTQKASSTPALEKIPHPNEIKNFEKVQKIGSALYGVRRDGGQKPVYVTAEMATCVKAAIDKKDLAVKNSITARSEKVFIAIDTRNTCQKLALDKTTAKEQHEANKICAGTFKDSMEGINNTMEDAKNDSRTAYETDLKSCSASLSAGTVKIDDGENDVTDSPAQ